MKRLYLSFIIALGLLGAFAIAQEHQHQHQATEPNKSNPQTIPMMGMAEHQQMMSAMVTNLVASFDKVRNAKTPAESQAAMEEHGKLLNELQKGFEQHRAAMAEKMKSCPMMQQSEHQGHEKEQEEKP